MVKEYNISDILSVKLEDDEQIQIYVKNKPLAICKHLLVIEPHKDKELQQIESIDDLKDYYETTEGIEPKDLSLSKEDELFGHYSNLQVWYENNYDTRLLDSRLAFPILKKLAYLGDSKAKMRFKEEILSRLENGNKNTIIYLISTHLDKKLFRKEELESLTRRLDIILESEEIQLKNKVKFDIVKSLIDFGLENAIEKMKQIFDKVLENQNKKIIIDIMRETNIIMCYSYKERLKLVEKLDAIFKPLKINF